LEREKRKKSYRLSVSSGVNSISNARMRKMRRIKEGLELGISGLGPSGKRVGRQNKRQHGPKRTGNNAGERNGRNDESRTLVLISYLAIIFNI
jgi:hypothetical protein